VDSELYRNKTGKYVITINAKDPKHLFTIQKISKFNLLTLKELHNMPTNVSDTAQDIWTLLSRKASMDAENPWLAVPFRQL